MNTIFENKKGFIFSGNEFKGETKVEKDGKSAKKGTRIKLREPYNNIKGHIVSNPRVIQDRQIGKSIRLFDILLDKPVLWQDERMIIKNKRLSVKKQNLKNRNVFYIKDLPNSLIDLKKKGDYIIDFVRSGNFLPLKSPSFQPQIIKNIYIYKVKLLKKVNFRNSNLYFENFKPIVRTGDNYGIKIILAKYKSGKELEYNDWKKLSKKINNLYE